MSEKLPLDSSNHPRTESLRLMIFKKIMEKLETKKNFVSGKETASHELTVIVEETLGLSLPSDYREFLDSYGFAMWFGHCICGIAPFNECNTLHYTGIARAGRLTCSEDGLVVLPYDGGGYYILVCSGQREGKVVLVGTDSNTVLEEWGSFTEFANYLLGVTP